MNCKLTNCNCNSFTEDGYCNKHRYWSIDTLYVCEHMKKYVDKISNAKTQKIKIKHLVALFNYLQYKETLFEQNKEFKEILLEKINELKQAKYDEPEFKKETFNAFDKVSKFYK